MRKEIAGLVEAVRGLRLKLDPRPGEPRKVSIGGSREDFLDGLHTVTVALQALDAAGSAQADIVGPEDASMDPANLRAALDGVFRWMKATGVDITEPYDIVSEALGGAPAKQQKAYIPVPRFATGSFRKKGGRPGPLLNLAPKPGEKTTMDGLRQKRQQILLVEAAMGPTMPR